MEVYVKPVKKANISERSSVFIKDFAEIVAVGCKKSDVEDLKVLEITNPVKNSYMVSIIDIVRLIKTHFPECVVTNLGEPEILIDYSPTKTRENSAIKWIKIAFVAVVLFIGSATAIMSFYSDAEMSKIFENFYFLIFGVKNDKPWIIEIPYSFGIATGIIVFFNHFAGKKVTDDPTPIEVEMSLYESNVADTMLDVLNTERARERDNTQNARNH